MQYSASKSHKMVLCRVASVGGTLVIKTHDPLSYSISHIKCVHGFVVLIFVMIYHLPSKIIHLPIFLNFTATGTIVWLPYCQWSKTDWYGQNIWYLTPIKHNKVRTMCIFLRIDCIYYDSMQLKFTCLPTCYHLFFYLQCAPFANMD